VAIGNPLEIGVSIEKSPMVYFPLPAVDDFASEIREITNYRSMKPSKYAGQILPKNFGKSELT
jgi:hypothetical protein